MGRASGAPNTYTFASGSEEGIRKVQVVQKQSLNAVPTNRKEQAFPGQLLPQRFQRCAASQLVPE